MGVVKISEIEKEKLALPLTSLDANIAAMDIRSKAEIPKISDGIYEIAIQEIMEKTPAQTAERSVRSKEAREQVQKSPERRNPEKEERGSVQAKKPARPKPEAKAQAKQRPTSRPAQQSAARTEKRHAQSAPPLKERSEQPVRQQKPASAPEPKFDEEGKTSFMGDVLPTINPVLKDLSTGEEIPLATNPFTIGKSKSCDLCIASKVVSRRHAEFRQDSDRLYIKDLGSTNGTFVGGFRLPPDTELEIKNGQEIIFANKKYKVRW